MSIRRAKKTDLDAIRELWQEMEDEIGGPDWVRETWEEERVDVERRLRDAVIFIAEEDGQPVAYLGLDFRDPRIAEVQSVHVRPAARRRGVASALISEAVAAARDRGYTHLTLDVLTSNHDARALYDRLGFVEYQKALAVSLDDLDVRLGSRPRGESFGRVFVQTDDETAIERAVAQFVPRLGRSAHTEVSPPRNGWIEIDDELCGRDPKALRRLGQELSYRTGGVVLTLGVEDGAVVRYVLLDRGSIADEYASVPEYYGPLPPGDVIALGANPTVVHRLTGADPERVRAVARTARSAEELPAPNDLYAQLAELLGVGSGSE
jgi:[ribosomal protein S18]-alanine N-acetyltransferase